MLNEIYQALATGRSVSSEKLARELDVTQDMIAAGLENLERANLIERVNVSTGCTGGSCSGCSCCGGVCSAPRLVMWKTKRIPIVEKTV